MTIPPATWIGSFGQRLGMTYTRVEPGRSTASWTVGGEHQNPSGVVHGGAVISVADDTMGAALHGLSPPGTLPASAQISAHFSRSARPGDRLRIDTNVLSHGRRTAVVESRVLDAADRLVALLTATYLFVEARHAPPATGELAAPEGTR